ncbi:MAG: maltotransferase domain-containing protein, partial [Ilumatobacteraceae bacterium]
MTKLPAQRPSRVVIEPVRPVVDEGAHPAKAGLGEPVTVVADVFAEGHDAVDAALRYRAVGASGRASGWTTVQMTETGNDRWSGSFVPARLGRHEFQVIGWSNGPESWRHGTERKVDADVDVTVELVTGVAIVHELLTRAAAAKPKAPADVQRLRGWRTELASGHTEGLADDWSDVFWRHTDREPLSASDVYPIDVDPELGRFSAWYEFFPRSTVSPATGHATLRDAIDRLDYVAAMGFDVVYLPPIHPIGVVDRKGANNAVVASDADTGSPWGIADHLAVHPDLGTLDDVHALITACRARHLELALDIAFQCTPDHPWVTEHPQWFRHRSDGSVQYAENPPKRYQDIYPIDFESADWQAMWQGLADVFRYWIDQGVTIFRVDNPHTKAFPFWEWVIADIRRDRPEVIFLAEAFTRPRVMERLAKVGFNQSYTYFAWRQSARELREYYTDLATRTVDYLRPNTWPNTPDILTEQLQHGGRETFVYRAILAATLSANWGVYGPAFELTEHRAVRNGSEEYLDSEKYQLRSWNLDDPDS